MSLQDLQRTIDQSVASASGFSRELFEHQPWSAAQVQDFINNAGSMTIATIDRTGAPHASVVPAGCADGTLYIGVTPRTALLGNLRRSEVVAFTSGGVVAGQGMVSLAGRADELKSVAPMLSAILREAIEQDWNGYFYTLKPSKIFATGPAD